MILKENYLKLKEKFSNVASWAVWEQPVADVPKSNMRSVSMFDDENVLQLLNPNYVFIGLNGSGVHDDYMDVLRPWHNFHSSNPRGHDYKLRYALMGTQYWGAYITDAIKFLPEVDSGKVSAYLSSNPDVVTENMQILKKEIEILGTNPTLICLGEKSYELVNKNLGNQFDVKKIIHYSYQIGKDAYKEHVLTTLSGENSIINIAKKSTPLPVQAISKNKAKSVDPAVTSGPNKFDDIPSLEKHLKMTGLDMPESWIGDIRKQLIALFEPIVNGTDFHLEINKTDTTKHGLNLFYKNDKGRCMGFSKIKNMRFLVYPTSLFYEEMSHKVLLPEADPKKRQPHMKMSLEKFWDVLYKITR